MSGSLSPHTTGACGINEAHSDEDHPRATVKVDFRSRVIPFRDREIAEQERSVWIVRGHKARIIERSGVYNVIVT